MIDKQPFSQTFLGGVLIAGIAGLVVVVITQTKCPEAQPADESYFSGPTVPGSRSTTPAEHRGDAAGGPSRETPSSPGEGAGIVGSMAGNTSGTMGARTEDETGMLRTDVKPCERYLPRGGWASPPSYGDIILGGDRVVLDGRIIDADLEELGKRRLAVKVELLEESARLPLVSTRRQRLQSEVVRRRVLPLFSVGTL